MTPDLQVVGHHLRRHAAEEGEGARVRADPVGQRLGPGRLGIGVVGGAEHGDEQLRPAAPRRSPRRSPAASCRHSRRTAARRRHASAAWSATAAPPRPGRARRSGCSRSRRGCAAAVLLPQQLQRHARPAQLAMDRRPVRLRPPVRLANARRRRIEPRLQRLVAQSPPAAASQAGPPRPPQMQSLAAVAPIARLAAIWRFDMPPAVSRSTSRILRMGNLCSGMPRSLSKGARQCRFADHPTVPVTPVHRPGRDRPEQVVAINRNGWSQSIGTGGRNHPVRAHTGAVWPVRQFLSRDDERQDLSLGQRLCRSVICRPGMRRRHPNPASQKSLEFSWRNGASVQRRRGTDACLTFFLRRDDDRLIRSAWRDDAHRQARSITWKNQPHIGLVGRKNHSRLKISTSGFSDIHFHL